MKKKLFTLAIVSLFGSTVVFAGAAFDGVNAQLGEGFVSLGSESNWSSSENYKYNLVLTAID